MNRVQTKFIKPQDSIKKSYSDRQIALIIPTTTRGLKIENAHDLPLMKYLWKSFQKWCSYKNYYHFIFGYDYDDMQFIRVMDEATQIFKDMIPEDKKDRFSFLFHKFDETENGGPKKGDLSTMWSILADKALDSGCEYLFQIGDDIELLSAKDWEDIFMSKLESMNNIGAVGPFDKNNSKVMTQSFVHCTHLSLFRRYFPEELKNWYIDDWMMEIYESKSDRQVIVRNCGGKERYKIEKMERVKDKIVKRDKKYVKSIRSCEEKNLMKIKSVKNFIYREDNYLAVCNSNLSFYDFKIDEEINSRLIHKLFYQCQKPEISFEIDNKIYHRSGNYIHTTHDGIKIVKNIENFEGDFCEDPIYLFQQFFIPEDKVRYEEVKECLRRNVNLHQIDRIYLLNERIYTKEEMGIDSNKIVQINIGERLTYDHFVRFSMKLKCYAVLSNSDIFLDETIENIRKGLLSSVKSVQCLRRYEYRGEEDLSKCKLYKNFNSSQDTWIFHTSQIDKNCSGINISLGLAGCDNKFAEFLREKSYIILNNYKNIKTYHNHSNEKRKHTSQLPGPFTYILGSYNLTPTVEIMNTLNLFWQYPVITEKTFFEQNKNDPKYFGLPWATIIDKKIPIDLDYMRCFTYRSNYYTCCQHIRFRNMISLFKIIGINKIYTPHKVVNEDFIDGIKIEPCPLYAKVVEDDHEFFKDLEAPRKYLYSFRGGLQSGYMSDIRSKIFTMNHPEECYIKNTGEWHFNQIVYNNKQNKDGEYNGDEKHFTKEDLYKDLLKNSRYTLCPSGTGPNSIRFWEALGAGSIPIILSDQMTLPDNPLWKESVIRIKEENVENIPQIISEISIETEQKMRKNCIELYKFYRNNYRNKDICI